MKTQNHQNNLNLSLGAPLQIIISADGQLATNATIFVVLDDIKYAIIRCLCAFRLGETSSTLSRQQFLRISGSLQQTTPRVGLLRHPDTGHGRIWPRKCPIMCPCLPVGRMTHRALWSHEQKSLACFSYQSAGFRRSFTQDLLYIYGRHHYRPIAIQVVRTKQLQQGEQLSTTTATTVPALKK